MAYNLQKLNVASLDFTEIKESLAAFLSQQEDLKDLDFNNNASAVNMLLNILATATAYNGIYAQYGYLNSFETTATSLNALLGIASNHCTLLEPTKTAKTRRTVIAGVTLEAYDVFTAVSPNGSEVFFYNKEAMAPNTTDSINLFAGNVVSYTDYNYNTQSIAIPYTVDPETITFETIEVGSNQSEIWTQVTRSSKDSSGSQNHYSVINGNLGYIITNNIPTAKEITTSYKVLVTGIRSNGDIGNNSLIQNKSGIVFGTTDSPAGGYNVLSLAEAKAKLKFRATSIERCVTRNDFKLAINSSGISGTETLSNIFVNDGDTPGQIKIFVTGLDSSSQQKLLDYLYDRSVAGISIKYSL